MHRELVKQATECSVNTVAKLIREAGIQARNKPKFRVMTTDSNHNLPIAPNRLNQQFSVSKINRVWLTDFPYLSTREGFSYLCEVKDLCSRRIVGWATELHYDETVVLIVSARSDDRNGGGIKPADDRNDTSQATVFSKSGSGFESALSSQ